MEKRSAQPQENGPHGSESIRERTGEVAILKTLGFRRNTILVLLVGESLVIALLGGLLGALGAKLAYAFIGITYTRAKLLGFAYAVGVGLLGGYGVWVLFAGSSAVRGWVKVTRYVSTTLGLLIGFGAGILTALDPGFRWLLHHRWPDRVAAGAAREGSALR